MTWKRHASNTIKNKEKKGDQSSDYITRRCDTALGTQLFNNIAGREAQEARWLYNARPAGGVGDVVRLVETPSKKITPSGNAARSFGRRRLPSSRPAISNAILTCREQPHKTTARTGGLANKLEAG